MEINLNSVLKGFDDNELNIPDPNNNKNLIGMTVRHVFRYALESMPETYSNDKKHFHYYNVMKKIHKDNETIIINDPDEKKFITDLVKESKIISSTAKTVTLKEYLNDF